MDAAQTPTVLALGAWLKNTACLLQGDGATFSAMHGDLDDAAACNALEASSQVLVAQARAQITAIGHDLHPDFYSTCLAQAWAQQLQVPAIAVQHHHAHIAAVMAEHRLHTPVIGLALDGVGLGTDGQAWGGELLMVSPEGWARLGHLWPLPLPGGDAAAREPWRMLVSVLHLLGRSAESAARLHPAISVAALRTVQRMLEKKINCPVTTSAGRWFDAAAAALDLQLQRQTEAQAAMALEQEAARWLGTASAAQVQQLMQDVPACVDPGGLDLRLLLERLLVWPDLPDLRPQAAAWFHLALAHALGEWAAQAARDAQCSVVCLGGGCFMNAVLTDALTHHLQAQGLRVYKPLRYSCGDAGLALGQAWVAAHAVRLAATRNPLAAPSHLPEVPTCA